MRVWTKNAICRNFLRKLSKIFKCFLKKIAKMDYFSIFCKIFNKPCVQFLRVWTKNAMCRKFLKRFRKFSKVFLRKLRKCIILQYFSKILTNNALVFRTFGGKTQFFGKFWENFERCKFYRKIEFFYFLFLFFGKFVTKNRDFGNNTIFLQHFFGLGGNSHFPFGYALAFYIFVLL